MGEFEVEEQDLAVHFALPCPQNSRVSYYHTLTHQFVGVLYLEFQLRMRNKFYR